MQRALEDPRQVPTHSRLHIRTAREALLVIYATYLGLLPKITQRLSLAERQMLQSGCVYVSERDMSKVAGGEKQLKRFTDGLKWSQSKNRDVRSLPTITGTATEYAHNPIGVSFLRAAIRKSSRRVIHAS